MIYENIEPITQSSRKITKETEITSSSHKSLTVVRGNQRLNACLTISSSRNLLRNKVNFLI